MEADGGIGSFSAYRPRHAPVVAVTFWAATLCLNESGESAVITAVRAKRVDVAPSYEAYLRTVEPSAVAAIRASERHNFSWGALRGTPPDFDEPYAGKGDRMLGRFSPLVEGARITGTCLDARTGMLAIDHDKVPRRGWTDLLIVVSAGKEGAGVHGLVIDYTVDGKAYEREVEGDMVVCDVSRTLDGCRPWPG